MSWQSGADSSGRGNPLTSLMVGLLFPILLLSNPVLAANDPGHDTLYVEEQGNSSVNGSLNISLDLRVAQRIFSDYLDVRGDGTFTGSTSRIIGTVTDLYIESAGDVIINDQLGTTNMFRVGFTGDSVDLNVTGDAYVLGTTLRVNGIDVCLSNGTNCVGGNNTGNVSSVTAGSGLTDSGTASDPVIDINLQANGGLQINSDALALNQSCGSGQVLKSDGLGNWTCEDDSGGTGGGGWSNTSTQTYTTLHVNVSNSTGTSILWTNSTSRNVGIGTTQPNETLVVLGESRMIGNQTWEIPGSDTEVCFERFVGTSQNYTRCINSTGHIVETIGTFPVS